MPDQGKGLCRQNLSGSSLQFGLDGQWPVQKPNRELSISEQVKDGVQNVRISSRIREYTT